MGNSMKKGYSFELDQYSKIPLTSLSDDSDEEDVLYGHNIAEQGKIELQLVPPQNGKPRKVPKPKRVVVEPNPKTGCVVCWIACVLATCIVIAIIGIIQYSSDDQFNDHKISNATYPVPHGLKNQPTSAITTKTANPTHAPGKDWEINMKEYGTESCVRLLDVNNDGILDIIFGATETSSYTVGINNLEKSPEEVCEQIGKPYPCLGDIFALSGTDGSVIWMKPTQLGVIFINCEDFDINLDGQKDCIITGRRGTIQAVNSKNGEYLWLGDLTYLEQTWNTYQVMALPDFDGDHVPEILLVNGGDPSKDPEDHQRKAGRLMILSGKTGKVLGSQYLKAPNDKEIYMSPMKYIAKDGSEYIFFGTGGETISGNFYVISVPDFYRYVMKLSRSAPVPNVKGQYLSWQNYMKNGDSGLIEILRGKKKGYMTPPVIVDVNRDGIDDILVSAYDGKITLLNGKDLSILWETNFPNMESYSTPAPGYFNKDDTLDFMVHWSYGEWPTYMYAALYVIDGQDGSIIMTLNSSMYQMSSDLTLHTTDKNRDIFMFKVRGRNTRFSYDKDGVIHGLNRTTLMNAKNNENHGPLGNPHKKMKRHGEGMKKYPESTYETDNSEAFQDFSMKHFLCTDTVDIKNEILLMDRTTMSTPVLLSEVKSYNYTYSVPDMDIDTEIRNVTMCIMMQPEDRTTGAVGDVDGDGILDLVSLVPLIGNAVDSRYSYKETIYHMYIKKVSLKPAMEDPTRQVQASVMSSVLQIPGEKNLNDVDFLPLEQQPWTQYQGKKGDGYYNTS